MAIITMDLLRAIGGRKLRRALFLGCDFDVGEGEHMDMELEDEIVIEGAQGHELVASEGAGGRGLVLEPSGYLLFVSSEAEAGVIAPSLTEGIELLCALPYWPDLLRRSNRGDLAEMRRLYPILQDKFDGDDPETEQARAFVRKKLSLQTPEDPIGALHRAVTELSDSVKVRNPDGCPYDSLFDNFPGDGN